MKEILQILLAIIGVSVLVWLYLRLNAWCEETFGFSFPWRRIKPAKVEIQSLFDGNTDEDQI